MSPITTPIEDLELLINKVVKDPRGSLFEMMPGGTQNPLAPDRIGNIYCSWANRRHTPRAGHFHKLLQENFFTLAGTVLWYFRDFRKESETFGNEHGLIVSEKLPSRRFSVPSYLISDGVVSIKVPPGVYHMYYPLTSKPAMVICISSRPYDPSDYFDPVKNKRKILTYFLKNGSIMKTAAGKDR